MKISERNYFSNEVRKQFLDVSDFKSFVGTPAMEGCEERTLASMNGEYATEKSTALLLGSFVDEMLLGTPESLMQFKLENQQMFSSRGETKGQLKAEFRKADGMVERARKDAKFMKYLDGDHQKIMTGTLFGMDWRIKIDNYIEHKAIVDLKTCEDMRKVYYSSGSKHNFIDYFGYNIQASIYQEIVFQNTGERLPFYFACISKQPIPDIEIIYIDDETMHNTIYGSEFQKGIANDVENIRLLLNGEVEPMKCDKCDYCLERKKIDRPIHYTELLGRFE